MKPTVVLGASPNPSRYSFLAVEKLAQYGHDVYPIGIRRGNINGKQIINDLPALQNIHSVTLYLGKKNQEQYYNYILDINPKRVIFNPGTHNAELMELLKKNKIEVTVACTLVMLQKNKY